MGRIIIFGFLFFCHSAFATMSIVAVDPLTGKVGSAGFTCLCNFDLRNNIAVVVPGKGAFNKQASYFGDRFFSNADNSLLDGLNAFEVIGENLTSFTQNNNANRVQILSATLNPGSGLNASLTGVANAYFFTGGSNGNVNYARYGESFAVAGNILISKDVVDDAYTAFNDTVGTLEDKLMAALLAAKRSGADSRCGQYNTSSQVAYLTTAQSDELYKNNSLELQHSNSCQATFVEPIDELFNQ